ncbi:MAG: DUF1385 domain-containing protein [Candidatus Limnocylindrales bacterium]
MASYHYGGQALIEGVLMRGRHALAVALRHPDGSIVWATERLDLGLRARRALKLPFLRGLVVLYDTLVTGTRWLVRSATIQALALEDADEGSGKSGQAAAGTGSILHTLLLAPAAVVVGAATGHESGYTDPDAQGDSPPAAHGPDRSLGKGYTVAVGGMLLFSLALGIGIFFLLPLLLAQATIGRWDQGFAFQLSEGLIRVAIFIGYLVLVGHAADVRRTFQYHGAEHMSIHTLEAGDPLTVEAARKYPTAHPRCGTEFLVVVLIVSILAFAVAGKLSPLWLVASRIILVPVIAAISYEILQLGARHRSHAVVRWLWSPGIWVQRITTRQPSDDMIEVAIVSLQRALIADGGEIPAGSAQLASRPIESDSGRGPDGEAAPIQPVPAEAPKRSRRAAKATPPAAQPVPAEAPKRSRRAVKATEPKP